MIDNSSTPHWRSPYADILIDRLTQPRRFMQVMSGPRQVGKTTTVLRVAAVSGKPHHYATADSPALRGSAWIAQQWNAARAMARQGEGAVLILDEIQKVPAWPESVKLLWDEDTRSGSSLQVVLLGSSPLLVHKGLSESLAGRFEMLRQPHWSFGEMRQAFRWNLEEFLLHGGYPGTAPLKDDPERLSAYIRDSIVEPTVARDILSLADVRRPALLRRLFELACVYCAEILSYNKMLGQLQDAGNVTTVAHYLNLLGEAGMVRGLQKYGGEARRRSSSPKLQPLATGLVTASSGISLNSWAEPGEHRGRLVECAVGAHLCNWAFSSGRQDIFYWRDRNHEVDFVVPFDGRLFAIEVKSGQTRQRGLPGIERFMQRYPSAAPLLVGGGGIPLEDFLSRPVNDWLNQ